MKEYWVLLTSIEDVKKFVNACSKVRGDVTVHHGRFAVDGKSILGVMSLDWSKPLKVEIYGDAPRDALDTIISFAVE